MIQVGYVESTKARYQLPRPSVILVRSCAHGLSLYCRHFPKQLVALSGGAHGGKRLLPLLGGSSAVWITCLVFFQTTLLLGYLCAHAIATRLPARASMVYGVFCLSLVQVDRNLNPHPQASTVRPVFSVLWVLTMLIGLPFLVLSATNPLLQSWYARAAWPGEPDDSSDATVSAICAFQFGIIAGVAGLPVLVEPGFQPANADLAWSLGFLLFVSSAE